MRHLGHHYRRIGMRTEALHHHHRANRDCWEALSNPQSSRWAVREKMIDSPPAMTHRSRLVVRRERQGAVCILRLTIVPTVVRSAVGSAVSQTSMEADGGCLRYTGHPLHKRHNKVCSLSWGPYVCTIVSDE